jgi:hypothetical protein
MKTKCLLLALCVVTLAGRQAAFGAVAFEAVTKTAIGGAVDPASSTMVRGWADGDRGRVELAGGRGALLSEGSVLFTEDRAATATLFDAPRRTCFPWSGTGSPSAKRPMPVEIRDVSVEKTVDEAGPEMLGRATHHYRFEISWQTPAQSGSSDAMWRWETTEELWTTEELNEPAMGLWLHTRARPSGDANADGQVQAALSEVAGIPLKRSTVLRVHGESSEMVTTITTEVTKLEEKALPADTFEVPEQCGASGNEVVR